VPLAQETAHPIAEQIGAVVDRDASADVDDDDVADCAVGEGHAVGYCFFAVQVPSPRPPRSTVPFIASLLSTVPL